MNKILFFALSFFLGGSVLADSNNSQNVGFCNFYDNRGTHEKNFSSVVGTVCKSNKGHLFKRIKIEGSLGVQDLGAGGVIWLDEVSPPLAYTSDSKFRTITETYCQKQNRIIPTAENFLVAEEHGFRDALNEIKHISGDAFAEGDIYWTGSSSEYGEYIFVSKYGSLQTSDYRTIRHPSRRYKIRCVLNAH